MTRVIYVLWQMQFLACCWIIAYYMFHFSLTSNKYKEFNWIFATTICVKAPLHFICILTAFISWCFIGLLCLIFLLISQWCWISYGYYGHYQALWWVTGQLFGCGWYGNWEASVPCFQALNIRYPGR